MRTPIINVRYDWGRDLAIVEIDEPGLQQRQVKCDRETLEKLIANLVEIRANMRERPPEIAPKQLPIIRDPAWELKFNKEEKLAQFNFRHPITGWQGIRFSSNKARKLGETFISLSRLVNE